MGLWSAVGHEQTSSHLPCGGAGGGYGVEHPAAAHVATDFTTLREHWVMFSRACGVVEGDGHE